MKHNSKTLIAAYHLTEALSNLSKMSPNETAAVVDMMQRVSLTPTAHERVRVLFNLDDSSRKLPRRRRIAFDDFRFEIIMQELRSVLVHSSDDTGASELDWLLKIILTSPAMFDSVRELDNFLSNMTATEHSTKSTGRDRVVEWYFKHINSLSESERDRIYFKIARHIFAQAKSNYREWKEVLYGNGNR